MSATTGTSVSLAFRFSNSVLSNRFIPIRSTALCFEVTSSLLANTSSRKLVISDRRAASLASQPSIKTYRLSYCCNSKVTSLEASYFDPSSLNELHLLILVAKDRNFPALLLTFVKTAVWPRIGGLRRQFHPLRTAI